MQFTNKNHLIVAILLICKILFDVVEFFETYSSCCEPKGVYHKVVMKIEFELSITVVILIQLLKE